MTLQFLQIALVSIITAIPGSGAPTSSPSEQRDVPATNRPEPPLGPEEKKALPFLGAILGEMAVFG